MDSADGCFGGGWFDGVRKIRKEEEKKFQVAPVEGEPSWQDIDSLIASEMAQISFQEREQALHDVHGISEETTEHMDLIDKALDQFALHLDMLKKGTACELAEAMSREYVSSKEFRTMFLRADQFKAKEAAERFIRFFELKRTLFGAKLLVKEITLADLHQDDLEVLLSGCAQVSPVHDTAGRPILTFVQKFRKYKDPVNVMRANFYMFMVVIRDTIAQKKGIATVNFHVGATNTKVLNSGLRVSLPVHIAAIHFCYDDPREHSKASIGMVQMNTQLRIRTKFHQGSTTECMYQLLTFGIPRLAIPVTDDLELLTHEHERWINAQRKNESLVSGIISKPSSLEYTPSAVPSVVPSAVQAGTKGITPLPKDVVFGRCRFARQHPGNKLFRSLIDRHMMQYIEAGKIQKTTISETVVSIVKNNGGRFLKQENNQWVEVGSAESHDKVSHAFRNRRKLHERERKGGLIPGQEYQFMNN